MDILLKVRCTKGQFVIYNDRVSIELIGFGVHNVNSMPFDQITGVELKTKYAAILGGGGMAKVTVFAVGNQKLEADIAPLSNAKKVEELIRSKIGKKNSEGTSSVDELEKLAVLKDKGLITEEEFAQKKKQILGI